VPEKSPYAGKRVLLAEDDKSSRSVLAKTLRALGCEVIEVDDGGRMLVAIASHYKGSLHPEDLDLVITDVYMPVCSGIDVFKGLRAAHWRTPVIVMTGHETKEVRDAVAMLDAVLLLKPLDLDVFEATVMELLDRPPRPRSDCVECAPTHDVRSQK
jgi:DNA-binding response OmpR family regulator